MTSEERLEELTERHEALRQSVEMLLQESLKQAKQIEALQLLAQRDGEHILALARIAEIHERRPGDQEDGE